MDSSNSFEFAQRRLIASADQINASCEFEKFEFADNVDRVGLPQRKIEKQNIGRGALYFQQKLKRVRIMPYHEAEGRECRADEGSNLNLVVQNNSRSRRL